MKKKLPQTSIDAYARVHPEFKSDHYGRILFAMRMIGRACSMQEIADYLKWDLVRVSRRMSELEKDTLVYVDGIGLSKAGRRCQLYSLTKHAEEKQDKEDTDFWEKLQNEPMPKQSPQFIQATLL
jgi:predicted ArsR family transcriptional regulator